MFMRNETKRLAGQCTNQHDFTKLTSRWLSKRPGYQYSTIRLQPQVDINYS